GTARVRLGVEEHSAGRQMLRWRMWPWPWTPALVAAGVLALLAAGALFDRAWLAAALQARPDRTAPLPPAMRAPPPPRAPASTATATCATAASVCRPSAPRRRAARGRC